MTFTQKNPSGNTISKGVLLVNLGSPDSPDEPDVRRYLAQFLMDPHVLDVPFLMRWLIVHGTILPKRPAETGKAYKSIWTEEGSPLVVISEKVRARLQSKLSIPVALGMRYGNPSIESALNSLDANEVYVIPMYPHYAASSYQTAVDEVRRVVQGKVVKFHPPFFDDPGYISALADSIRPYQNVDHILFSYHGLPERHIQKADPTGRHCLKTPTCCDTATMSLPTCYRAQVFRTTRMVAEKLNLKSNEYSLSFQSRLGRDPWLRPFTDEMLVELGKFGVKRLAVVCPAFVSDCLETLEEIGDRGRKLFLDAGGDSFQLIPCLNDSPAWLEVMAGWV